MFEFPEHAEGENAIRDILTSAGYLLVSPSPAAERGGFMSTEPAPTSGRYCKGEVGVTFGAVDFARAPDLIAINVIDGDVGRENCSPKSMQPRPRGGLPVTLPTLTPPAGATPTRGSNSSWNGAGGTVSTAIVAIMPADSVLANYVTQLSAGGWKATGHAAAVSGPALQQFTFHDGDSDWSAALIVLAVGDRRDVSIEFSKID